MIKHFVKVLDPIYQKCISISAFIILLSILINCSHSKPQKTLINFETAPDSLELLFPDAISTHLTQRDFALSPDRNEIIYTLGNQKESRRMLVSLKKENGKWGDKTMLPFCGTYQDIEPFFSPDGKLLFFASNRPIYDDSTRTDYNIWVSKKENNTWQKPVALDSTINTKGKEYYPSVTNSGNLYFTATRPEGFGLEDIYRSEYKNGQYQNPKVLDSTINSKSYEFNAYVNPEETLIFYSSYGRPDGHGGGDLYYSTKDANDIWQPAKNFGAPINSNKLDFCPYYDSKTHILYFSSLRTNYPETFSSVDEFIAFAEQPTNGLSSIYRVSIKNIIE
ncbi:exo-alpha-sialidase [Seonamhaeicola sp.]|uniref:TolB family protein n=1 Tax=Seonamhaeicola sp. TaxID=1912245 RepID=UPI00260FF8D7|nr:exo-alpha-sialidase [Seonamhaeicola sp.]